MEAAKDMIAELEKRAKVKGVPIRQVVRAAGVNVSTWTRWKSGDTTPTFRMWEKVTSSANSILGPASGEAA